MMVTCCGKLFLERNWLVVSTGLNPACNPGPVYKGTHAFILEPSAEVTWRTHWLLVFLKYPVLCNQHSLKQPAGCFCCLCLLQLDYSINLQLHSLLLLPCPSLQSTGTNCSSICVGLQYTKPELTFSLPLQSKEAL